MDYSTIGGSSSADLSVLKVELDGCVEARCWQIHYFHSVGSTPSVDNPFHEYVEYVASLGGSLWVAPQGTIAEYSLARDCYYVSLIGRNPGQLSIVSGGDGNVPTIPLTVRVHDLTGCLDAIVLDGLIVPFEQDGTALTSVAPGDTIQVVGARLIRTP